MAGHEPGGGSIAEHSWRGVVLCDGVGDGVAEAVLLGLVLGDAVPWIDVPSETLVDGAHATSREVKAA